ncbi:alpha-2,3-sialyltransferase [Campylobacter sp. MG1]|uniref:alpha-2,3-sialyltransferase n=1 Tax=Campylobacter sp. MG1 TaxID=2976332 RepID=UPI00226D0A88|nr:alpha-2,3-sialyltransferase [Campylobacter sp. MG1]
MISNFKRDSENLIVVGNGPSLKNIDLSSLPQDYDVFRCNQFYCEDKYYLGKNIKLVMFNPMVIYSQLKTIHEITKKNEYNIEHICLNYINQNWDCNFDLNYFKNKMPFVLILRELLEHKILKEICLLDEYDKLRPTSGILLMLLGKSLGYKNIYFIGMDFAYKTSKQHIGYDKNSNINNIIYNNVVFSNNHSPDIDLKFIENNMFKKLDILNDEQILCENKYNYINDIIIDKSNLVKKYTSKLKKIIKKFKLY